MCVLVPGLYSEIDGSSECNQVYFCLVKDGNLLTIFGEKREKKVKNRFMQNSIIMLFTKFGITSNSNLFEGVC